jgi:hypothetical protein
VSPNVSPSSNPPHEQTHRRNDWGRQSVEISLTWRIFLGSPESPASSLRIVSDFEASNEAESLGLLAAGLALVLLCCCNVSSRSSEKRQAFGAKRWNSSLQGWIRATHLERQYPTAPDRDENRLRAQRQ